MKFSCTQENLQRGLGLVSHLANKNVNLPILNNVLLKTEDGGLVLATTNLEIGVKCQIRGKIESEGSFTVPAGLLNNYVGLLKSDRVDIEKEGTELKVYTDKQKTKIKGEGANEFPIIPEVERKDCYKIKREDFQKGLSQVVFAASMDDTRPEISGVLFNFQGSKLVLAATDSYRLAEKKLDLERPGPDKKVIIPQFTLTEVLRILSSSSEESVEMCLTENQVLFIVGDVELVSRVIEGNYPDYEQIIPKENKTSVMVSKDELGQAVKAVSLFSKAGINDVNFKINQNEIELSAVNAQLGENVSNVMAEVAGETNDIVFNYNYLLDGLNNLVGDKVGLEIIDGTNPGIFRSMEDDRYLYIIMPIKQ